MKANFDRALAFVWQPGYDNPRDGYHVEAGDPGGGTLGGVIEATWAGAISRGIVSGPLRGATDGQLAAVLRAEFWGAACDRLDPGIDLLLFNGRMMSGRFPRLLQTTLGLIEGDCDGSIGDATIAAANHAHAPTLIDAITGAHWSYLYGLPGFARDGRGWTKRINAARVLARSMLADR